MASSSVLSPQSTISSPQTFSALKPRTLTGSLVKKGKVKSFLDLRRLKLDLKVPEIIDVLYPGLQEEILKVVNIGTGQYQRKAFVAVGNKNGLIGLGKKCGRTDKEAIEGAKRNARLSVFQLDLPSNKTVPRSVKGQFGSVTVKLEPFIMTHMAHPMIIKVLEIAGFTAVLQTGNSNKASAALVEALFDALSKLKLH